MVWEAVNVCWTLAPAAASNSSESSCSHLFDAHKSKMNSSRAERPENKKDARRSQKTERAQMLFSPAHGI